MTVPPRPSMLPRMPSCWLLSWPLMRSFSSRSSLRPALACCSATESPASCTTTVTGALLTPSGVHTGVTRLAPSLTASGRTAAEVELPRTPKASASAATARTDLNRISPLPRCDRKFNPPVRALRQIMHRTHEAGQAPPRFLRSGDVGIIGADEVYRPARGRLEHLLRPLKRLLPLRFIVMGFCQGGR